MNDWVLGETGKEGGKGHNKVKRMGEKRGKSRQDHIRLRNLPEICPLFIFIIMAIKTNARSTQRLVDVPLGTTDTTLVHGGQLTEEVTRQIDGAVVATHALVDHNTSGGLAVVCDGDGFAAVTIGHDTVGQGENVLHGTIVGGAAGAGVGAGGGSVVEGDVTVARGALGADAGAAAASLGVGCLSVGGTSGSRGSGRRGLSLYDGSGSGRGLGLHGGSGSGSGGGGGGRSLLHLLGRSLNSRDRGSGSGGGGGGSGGRSLLYLLSRGLNNGDSGGGRDGVGDHRDDSSSVSGLRVDGGGDIDGGPDDISDGLPNDGAFGNGSRVASQGEESASKGESLSDRSHCE